MIRRCLFPRLSHFQFNGFSPTPYSPVFSIERLPPPSFRYGQPLLLIGPRHSSNIAGEHGSQKRKVAKKKHNFIPRKAPIELTETSRLFFKQLLESRKDAAGILLNYHQSSTGEPRMVFSFDFVKPGELGPDDEGVSLEVMADGSPKPPAQSLNDGLPKLYVHHNAFMKTLGGKVDVDLDTLKLTMYDREGNIMDPNA
jgi:hypothetical protein